MPASTYAVGSRISYMTSRAPAVVGKPFATFHRMMDRTSSVYWPYSPDGPGRDPVDIPWSEPVHIDAFLDRMQELTGDTRRRLRESAAPVTPRRRKAHGGREAAPKIEIVLYVSAASEKSHKALRAIREVLAQYVPSQVKFSTCDLSLRPEDGEVDSVVFTPTLVKQGPGPRTSIIGNLDQADLLKDLLDASGVERRRWDD